MRLEVYIIMNLSKISYSFYQAKKNMIRNGLMTVASLFTITSCLVILGIFTVLSANVTHISNQVKDQCEVQLFLKQETPPERVSGIKEEIEAIANVKDISFFSREDMLLFAKNDMFDGDETLLVGLDGEDNPFSDSYKITLKDISLTSETVAKLELLSDVEHVENKQDVVNTIISISDIVGKLSLLVMGLLLVIAIVIISNTVRLTVFNRRKEINIMKYIGATDRFIRVPFIMEGIIIGFLSAVIAFGLASWGYLLLLSVIDNYNFDVFSLLGYIEIVPRIAILFVCVGCLIGVIGSAISMRKYLKA